MSRWGGIRRKGLVRRDCENQRDKGEGGEALPGRSECVGGAKDQLHGVERFRMTMNVP